MFQGSNGLSEERVFGDGAHGIIADSRGNSETHPCWVDKERVQRTLAAII